jgi:hypothetical protein
LVKISLLNGKFLFAKNWNLPSPTWSAESLAFSNNEVIVYGTEGTNLQVSYFNPVNLDIIKIKQISNAWGGKTLTFRGMAIGPSNFIYYMFSYVPHAKTALLFF